jgi:hypothetical protein
VRFWGITTGAPYLECPTFAIEIRPDDGGKPHIQEILCETRAAATCELVDGFPGFPSYEHCVVLAEPCTQDTIPLWLTCQALYCRDDLPGSGVWYWAVHLPQEFGSEIWYRTTPVPWWIPGHTIFGEYYDASFELLTGGATPAQDSSWGRLKALFR